MNGLDPRGTIELLALEREHIQNQARGRAAQETRPRNAVRTRAAHTLRAGARVIEPIG